MLGFQRQEKHYNDHNQRSAAQRKTGVVKIYKTVEGFGFFKVPGQSDVYFNTKDLEASHVTVPPNVGETYSFDVEKKYWADKSVKLRASRIFKVPFNQIQPGLSSEWTNYRDNHGSVRPHYKKDLPSGNSGPMNARGSENSNSSIRPHYKKDLPSGNSGAINVRGSGNTNDTSKYQAPIMSAYKIGNPVRVPIGKPTVVSATGPNSAEMAPHPMEESTRKLQEDISRKKSLLKSLDLTKLPDGGRRLREQIESLESEFKKVCITVDKETVVTESSLCKPEEIATHQQSIEKADKPVNSGSHSSYIPYQSVGKVRQESNVLSSTAKKVALQSHPIPETQFGAKFMEFTNMPGGPLFGGRMTNDRLSEVRLVRYFTLGKMRANGIITGNVSGNKSSNRRYA